MSPIQKTQRQDAWRTKLWATNEPNIDIGAILNSVQAKPTERYLFGTSSDIPAYFRLANFEGVRYSHKYNTGSEASYSLCRNNSTQTLRRSSHNLPSVVVLEEGKYVSNYNTQLAKEHNITPSEYIRELTGDSKRHATGDSPAGRNPTNVQSVSFEIEG